MTQRNDLASEGISTREVLMNAVLKHPVVSLVALIILAGLIWGKIDPSSLDKPELDRNLAESRCEDFVKDRLKSPSTAKFPSEHTRIRIFDDKSPDNKSLEVEGDVDAQNEFGAILRRHYFCTVHKDGSSWELLDLKIGEN